MFPAMPAIYQKCGDPAVPSRLPVTWPFHRQKRAPVYTLVTSPNPLPVKENCLISYPRLNTLNIFVILNWTSLNWTYTNPRLNTARKWVQLRLPLNMFNCMDSGPSIEHLLAKCSIECSSDPRMNTMLSNHSCSNSSLWMFDRAWFILTINTGQNDAWYIWFLLNLASVSSGLSWQTVHVLRCLGLNEVALGLQQYKTPNQGHIPTAWGTLDRLI